ncbi:MAG TPA: TonB-dependent receptor [Terriglobia bacterium]|nr:TonB-dependent receptor [Terriglobia bacterium]
MTVLLTILLLITEYRGQVSFNGLPVPGATVTATQGEKKFTAITDPMGTYVFPDLPEGTWVIEIEMLGFVTLKGDTSTSIWELKMLPVEEIKAESAHNEPAAPASAPVAAANTSATRAPVESARRQSGFQRTEVIESNNGNNGSPAPQLGAPTSASAFANVSQDELNHRAADGLLINGSVNNGAASPFGQLGGFGNNRRGVRPLYTGGIGVIVDNSALDARTFSLTGQDTPKPAYNRFTGSFNFGGPLKIPGLINNNGPNFFAAYQRIQNRNAVTTTGRMPTSLERNGDFSQSLTALGQPVRITDPLTGVPFNANIIPPERISPQAESLLTYFPLPNFNGNARYNYQIPVINATHSDSLQTNLNKAIGQRNQLFGNFAMQSTRTATPNIFNFLDNTRTLGINTAINWTTRPTQRFSATFRYQFSRLSTHTTPFFANRLNVAGAAGITGNNQEPVNWGPPTLSFAGGTSTMSDAQFSFNRNQTNTVSYSSFWNHGRHNLTFGGDIRRQLFNILSQQDPRGTFTFTGAAAGVDTADFLLGIPDASEIAFGNADKYFRQTVFDGFVQDDWRVNGALTLNGGARWEYETPISELYGRLVNLNIAPGFSAVSPVTGNNLIHPDKIGIQPRVAFAWRPIAASSVIVRGSYGVYRNTNVYQSIAVQMAQQSPLSKSLRVQNTPASPLTLRNGFITAQGVTPNTFAIDPNFRIGYAQNWMLSLQRDLPAALQMTASYLGTKGTRLPQEFLPNTFPAGAINSSGYIFLTSNGNSTREAGQIQLRRRLRSGFAATLQYTYAKAIDDAPLMGSGQVVTVTQGGASIAQDWLDLAGERGRSNFDQRHQMTLQAQYTFGSGVRGGALVPGWMGALLKEWTLAESLTVGSGLPLTPVYFLAVPGTGVTGNLRPDATGSSIYAGPAGLFLNPGAYRAPVPGQWGNAGRNSITGPSQFILNATLGRTFPRGDRFNIDLKVDATNVLNHVTFSSWNTIVNNAQFGLPNNVNAMRSIQTTLRVRF